MKGAFAGSGATGKDHMFKRILMNQVDSGSGNGAAPAPTAVPDDVQPQAQGASLVTMTKEALDATIASAAEQAIAKAKDSIYAEARRTFTGTNKSKPNESTPTGSSSNAAQPPAPDAMRLRSLDRALSKSGLAERLTDSQYQRAERAFAEESPGDVEGWVKDYFSGFGGSPAPTASAPAAAPLAAHAAAPQRNVAPVSDRGSPPVSAVPLDEQDLLSMSPSDRDALLKQKGMKWFTDKVLEQSKGKTYRLR